MRILQDISEWVKKMVAVDGDSSEEVGRLEILVPGSGKAWLQHADVKCPGKTPEKIVNAVLSACNDIADSATANGQGAWRVRIRRYVDGAPAGSRTFTSAPGAFHNPGEDAAADAKDEITLVIRELRMLATTAFERSAATADAGWRLALQLQQQNTELQRQISELTTGLAVAEVEKQNDGSTQKLISDAMPLLLQVLQSVKDRQVT